MRYIGHNKEAALALFHLDDVIWRLAKSSKTVVHITDEERVQSWRLFRKEGTYVLKYSTQDRLFQAAPQMAAECQASMYLSVHGAHPLLVLPDNIIMDPKVGGFTIMPDAGVSTAMMNKGPWAQLSADKKAELTRNFVISALLTQRMYGTTEVESDEPGPKKQQPRFLHRDIKLENSCWSPKHEFFKLIDYGLFSSVDRTIWVNGVDKRYIDCQMAYLDPATGTHSALSADGIYAMTFPSSDIFQTGLAAVELFLGDLPQQIRYSSYSSDADYCTAVWGFEWDKCPELAAVPSEMREWLLWALSFNPADRPQCAEEALNHSWLRDHVAGVVAAIDAAKLEWEQSLQALDKDIRGFRTGSSSSSGMDEDDDVDGEQQQQDSGSEQQAADSTCCSCCSETLSSSSSGDDSSSLVSCPDTPTCSPSAPSTVCCSPQLSSISSSSSSDGIDHESSSITGGDSSSNPAASAAVSSNIVWSSHLGSNCSVSIELSSSGGDSIPASPEASPADTPSTSSCSSSSNVFFEAPPAAAAAAGGVSTASVDTPSQSDIHVMLLLVKDPGQTQLSVPTAAAAVTVTAEAGTQVDAASLQQDHQVGDCAQQQTHTEQQQQDGPSALPPDSSHKVFMSCLPGLSHRLGAADGSSSSSSRAVNNQKGFKRRFTAHVKAGCRVVAAVMAGIQHRTHSL